MPAPGCEGVTISIGNAEMQEDEPVANVKKEINPSPSDKMLPHSD